MKKRAGSIMFCFIQAVFLVLAGCENPTGDPPATTADISSVSISGLVAPATGAMPVTAGALSPGASTYSVQSLDWSPTVSGTFANNTSYTATIVLKTAAGCKFTGTITPDTGGVGTPLAGTISGDTTENTLSFTMSFPATTAAISSVSISGLVAPVTGATPTAAGALTPGASTYSIQSLDWSPPVSGTFNNNTSYTATIVLKAGENYKFTGTITPDTGGAGTPSAGTIGGGDVTGNTLSFTVSFPATAVATEAISSVSISGLVAPATGAAPITVGSLSPGASTYTAQSLNWSPTVSGTFAGGQVYTATIVLKATAGHKFAGTINPTTGGAGTPSAGTIGGGDTAENTLSFTVSFPATETSASDSVIGVWRVTHAGETTTYTFKDSGVLESTEQLISGDHTSTYTYDSATKRIYYNSGNPPQLYGTYSVSGAKLTLARIDTDSYTRQGSGSGLIGVWRRPINSNHYYEYEFKSDGTVIDSDVWDGEVDKVEYSYTVSGDKIAYLSKEIRVAQLSGTTLNVYMSSEPASFTRQGGGSDIIGTWTGAVEGNTTTFVITSDKLTFTGVEFGEYSCRIDGNDVFVKRSWEVAYSINTNVDPHILTITRERARIYNRVD